MRFPPPPQPGTDALSGRVLASSLGRRRVFHAQAVLGLEYDLAAKAIRLHNPAVPMSAGEITVRNLMLGGASISFTVKPYPNGTVSSA